MAALLTVMGCVVVFWALFHQNGDEIGLHISAIAALRCQASVPGKLERQLSKVTEDEYILLLIRDPQAGTEVEQNYYR